MQKTSTKTIFDYWNGVRGSRSAPDRRDIDPTRIRDALANTFILETGESGAFSFRLAGSHLCNVYCRELKGRSFADLWHQRDREAMETLIRAVTEDHAVALVTFQATTALAGRASFETILLPLRHNGTTHTRVLGALTAIDVPFWLGTQAVTEQRITGLRLIWPDEAPIQDFVPDMHAVVGDDIYRDAALPAGMPAIVYGRTARRYAHLAVIDGGRGH